MRARHRGVTRAFDRTASWARAALGHVPGAVSGTWPP